MGSTKEVFDPYEYINKTYSESSLYELTEALTFMSNINAKTKHENKKLISSHFTKFIECRTTLENIYEDVKNKNLKQNLTDRLKKVITMLLNKYNAIFINVKDDLEQEMFNNKRIYYENEFAEILTLKANLSKNVNNFENFVNLYKRAKKLYEPYKKSKFLSMKINEIQPEINTFLENIYSYICNEHLNFDESCYYFDLYFEIANNKTDRKIMNTLLVTFKECTYAFNDVNNYEEYITYLEESLLKFINYVDDDIKKEGINHYFKCLTIVITDVKLAKIAFKQVEKIINNFDITPQIKQYFIQRSTEAKSDIFFNLLKNNENFKIVDNNTKYDYFITNNTSISAQLNKYFDQSVIIYTEYQTILKENEVLHIQDILLDHIKISIEQQNINKYEFFKLHVTSIRKCLGSRKSIKNKQLDKFLKEKQEKAILELSNDLEKLIDTTIIKNPKADNIVDNIIHVFIQILQLLNKTSVPILCEVLFETRGIIIKNKILWFFLYKFIKMKDPELDDNDKIITKNIFKQFSFFRSEIIK